MAHRHAIADGERNSFVQVQRGVVLNVTLLADLDQPVVSPHRDVGPNAGSLADGDFANDYCAGIDVSRDGDPGCDAAERTNHGSRGKHSCYQVSSIYARTLVFR